MNRLEAESLSERAKQYLNKSYKKMESGQEVTYTLVELKPIICVGEDIKEKKCSVYGTVTNPQKTYGISLPLSEILNNFQEEF